MKKSVLFALVLSFGLINVASAAQSRVLASCTLAQPMMDYGISVQINQTIGPIGSIIKENMQAVVSESTFAGPRDFGTFAVTQQLNGAIGAPRVYTGKDFNLEIDVDTAPVNTRIRAHMTADAQGRRLSEDMLCTLN